MIKKTINFLLGRRPTDIDSLITNSLDFPRYTPHQFVFRGLKISTEDFISVAYQIKEFFGDKRMDFYSERPDPIIIDCGANVGISILRFKSLFPKAKINAFEPDKNIFKCLEANLKANNVTDVILIQKAVWTNNDGVDFGSEGADGGSIFFSENINKVPTIRLKDFLSSFDQIDFLKIDIEGAETDVLIDCKEELKKVKYLFVEYHSFVDQPQNLDKLLNVLNENLFRYYIHSIGHIHEQPFMKQEKGIMDIQLDIHAIRQ